jgi:hypothetical protein
MKFLVLDAADQVKLFIELAQLAGHPVIYDVLPQTARFSKIVLSKPYVARWFDINALIVSIMGYLNAIVAQTMQKRIFKDEEVLNAQKAYIETLKRMHL